MQHNLTKGPITSSILLFAFPMILGNLLQQCYNIADTLIVGRFLGANALAAVGSAYTLMTFLTSIFIGLCMGSGVLFSIYFGKNDMEGLKHSIFLSFTMIGFLTLILNIGVFCLMEPLLVWLHIPLWFSLCSENISGSSSGESVEPSFIIMLQRFSGRWEIPLFL